MASIAETLRSGGDVDDADFDALYPADVRAAGAVYWTPVSVATRAAALLAVGGTTRILDVGAGIGKFCIIAAAVTGTEIVGLEHRARFVDIARAAAERAGVTRVRFEHGGLEDVDPEEYDAFYFFNPFEENNWTADEQLDQSVPLSRQRFVLDVNRAEHLLARARVGARVVTYHGFGGAMPEGYRHVGRERHPRSYLDSWVKAAHA